MKKIGLSLISASLLVSNLNADMLTDALTHGVYEGSAAAYMQSQNNDKSKDKSYLNAHVSLFYNTADVYNFSLGIEGKGNLKLAEKNRDDWKNGAEPNGLGLHGNNLLMTQAYLKYELQEGFIFKAGRYEADLAWFKNYQQGAMIEVSAIPDVLLTVAYSDRQAESGIDVSEDFHSNYKEQGFNKGIYTIDIKDRAIEGFDFNPYFYQVPDAIKFYGLKTGFDLEHGGLKLEYARSNLTSKYRDATNQSNGYIAHAEIFGKVEVLKLTAGGIVTSDKGGATSMWYFGDTITPFVDANQSYSKDARTLYGSININIEERFIFNALYGYTRYDTDTKSGLEERELNLGLKYNFMEELSAEFKYVNVKADSKQTLYGDYDKYIASIEYKF
ncbi:putative outer membrane protein [Aliarcobacter thereius]|uniref:Putative outer membrane protein n=1 Tax=Aliarcobacter thereius TaxID=544718 RepID=A0A1C0B8W5_9BACT|nr:Opr family porin [Aliarcobacter thereius]OCL88828.1 putative outer membrane protein [Aliarcobacter thereius]OCM00021.1 putative outer membrane protein [Aliarcobacter thereius]TLT05857.1 outer membrane family protein [Aliarcobacter thereius]HJE02329.1 Opr family porin [Aliarcobacter thereius]